MHKVLSFALALAVSSCGSGETAEVDGDAEVVGDVAIEPLGITVGAFAEPTPYVPGQLACSYVAATLSGSAPWPEVRFALTSSPPGIDATIEPAIGIDLGAAERDPSSPPELRSNLCWSLADDLAPGRYVVAFRATAGDVSAEGNVAFDVVTADAPGLVAGADVRFIAAEAGHEARYVVRATAVGGASGRVVAEPLADTAGDYHGRAVEVAIADPIVAANGSTELAVTCPVSIAQPGTGCGVRVALGRHVVDVPVDLYATPPSTPSFELTWAHNATPLRPDESASVSLLVEASADWAWQWPPTVEVSAPPGTAATVDLATEQLVRVDVRRQHTGSMTGPADLEVRATIGGVTATATLRLLLLADETDWPWLGAAPLSLVPSAFGLDEHGRPAVTSAQGMVRWSGGAWTLATSSGWPFLYTPDGALWEIGTSPSLAVQKNGRPQSLYVPEGAPRDAFLALDPAAVGADALPLVLVDLADLPLRLYRTTPTPGTNSFVSHSVMPLETITRDTFPRFAVHGDEVFVLLRGTPGLALWGYDADGWTPRATPAATLGALLPLMTVDRTGDIIIAWLDADERVHAQRYRGGWHDLAPPIGLAGRVVLGLDLALGPDDRVGLLVHTAASALGDDARLEVVRETDAGWQVLPTITPVDALASIRMSALQIDPTGALFVVDHEPPLAFVRWRPTP